MVWVLSAGLGLAQEGGPQTQSMPASPPAAAPAEQGTLVIALSGNRKFCVEMNEIPAKPGTIRPREQRTGPLITTFGYKYQISSSRRGSAAVVKLFESRPFRTAYVVKVRPPELPKSPRLATPQDIKRASRPFSERKSPRWIPENTCTTLAEEFSFQLPPGRYDFYLGFDLLVHSGQWVPFLSDFVSNVLVEKERVTRVHGTVNYADGERTVKLESAEPPQAPGRR